MKSLGKVAKGKGEAQQHEGQDGFHVCLLPDLVNPVNILKTLSDVLQD